MEALSLFLLWLLFGCRNEGGSAAPPLVPALPGGQPGWPGSPITYTPPWPQALPSGLPPFPGKAWEFDEPPPPAVQQRARQLVDELWARGSGAYRIEQVAGRWIAFQAQIVASGRKGVVAYRQKSAALPAGGEQTAMRRAPAPRPQPISSPSAPTQARTSTPAPAAAKPPVKVRVGPAQVHPVSPVGLPTLVRGAGMPPKQPSPNVRVLQQRLGGLKDDGMFGPKTEQAVIAFQRANGLPPNGIVDDKTWTALFGGVRV